MILVLEKQIIEPARSHARNTGTWTHWERTQITAKTISSFKKSLEKIWWCSRKLPYVHTPPNTHLTYTHIHTYWMHKGTWMSCLVVEGADCFLWLYFQRVPLCLYLHGFLFRLIGVSFCFRILLRTICHPFGLTVTANWINKHIHIHTNTHSRTYTHRNESAQCYVSGRALAPGERMAPHQGRSLLNGYGLRTDSPEDPS